MATTDQPADSPRPKAPRQWRWALAVLLLLGIGVCMAVAFARPLAGLFVPEKRPAEIEEETGPRVGDEDFEYESQAIIEVKDNRPPEANWGALPQSDVAAVLAPLVKALLAQAAELKLERELPGIRTRMLSWQSVRDLVLGRHVDFGRDIDPDDRRQLERIHFEVTHKTRLTALGPRHIAVTHRSRIPQKNASMVNELVKQFVGEDRRFNQEQAKEDLRYYKEHYAGTQARLAEIDSQIREFMQANPWLREAVGDINKEYKEAEEKLMEIVTQIGEDEADVAKLRRDLQKEKPEIEVVKQIPPPPELTEAQRERNKAKAAFGVAKKIYQPDNPRYQDARAKYEETEAYLSLVEKEKGGGPSQEKWVEPNPAYVQIDREVKQLEKAIEKQNQRKLALDKRCNELYVLVRRAPELLAQLRKLDEERSIASTASEEYSRYVRQAGKDLNRLLTDAYSSRYHIVEYARETYTPAEREPAEKTSSGGKGGKKEGQNTGQEPAEPGDRDRGVREVQSLAAACAVGMGVGMCLTLLLVLAAALFGGRRAEPKGESRRGRAAVKMLLGLACLALPIVTAAAGVLIYRSFEGTPHVPADEARPAPLPASGEIEVETFVTGVDIRFPQVNPATGFVTRTTHVFREVLPDDRRHFKVVATDDRNGKIVLYRLRNVATGETFDLKDVPVRSTGTAGWAIEPEVGWKTIRDQLQAELKIDLALPVIGRK